MALRHPDLFLSFPLCRSTRVPHRRLFLLLLHKFTALNCTTAGHGIACWWDKQHFYTWATLSSKWQYFLLLARVDNWVSFVPLSTVRPYLSPIASDLVIWQWDVFLSSPAKEFRFSFMSLMWPFIYVPRGLSGHLALKTKNSFSPSPFTTAAKTSFVTPWNEAEGTACYCTITCPLIIHAFSKLPELTPYVWWIPKYSVGSH